MRKNVLILVKTVLVLSLAFATGCSKDDGGGGNNGGKTVPDPEGTIAATISKSDGVPVEKTISYLDFTGSYTIGAIGWTEPNNLSVGAGFFLLTRLPIPGLNILTMSPSWI